MGFTEAVRGPHPHLLSESGVEHISLDSDVLLLATTSSMYLFVEQRRRGSRIERRGQCADTLEGTSTDSHFPPSHVTPVRRAHPCWLSAAAEARFAPALPFALGCALDGGWPSQGELAAKPQRAANAFGWSYAVR